MTGGASQTTAATPWSPTQPYLLDIMQQAQKQYGTTSGQYSNPASNFGYNPTTGAVGSIINGTNPYGSMATSLTPGTVSAIQQNLTGTPDYTQVKSALDAANQQTWDSFNNQALPQLNQNASFLGNPSGSIKDLNWAVANIGKNMDLNAQQQYLGEYDRAKAAQLNAAGLGANIAQGAAGQTLQGASLFGSLSQLPQQNLANYADIVGASGGKFGTQTQQINPGGAQTAANIIGGLTAAGGLINTLTGNGASGGGAIGAIGNLFGNGAGLNTAAIGSQAGSAAAGLGSGASAGMAGTAADVAAANSAWLGGGGAGVGAAAASEPALASVGTGAVNAAADSAAASAGSSLGSGAGAAGGSLGGALAGGAIVAAPLIAGRLTKPVQLNQAYFTKVANNLTSADPSVRIPAISQTMADPAILQHIQIDNPALYQQLVTGQAMRDALNAYSAKQIGGGGVAVQRGTQRA